MNKGLLTSNTYEWATPKYFYDELDKEFHFNLDPCATKENAKCKDFFTIKDDGLCHAWFGNVFMNPPYGREIYKWVRKAYFESLTYGKTVVCLLPSRTDTKWWHEYCMKGEIRFIKGRLKFIGCGVVNSAPFPSVVVIFRGKKSPSKRRESR